MAKYLIEIHERTDVDNSSLNCPRCLGNNLHQVAYTIFERAEDDSRTAVTVVRGQQVTTGTLNSNDYAVRNPSTRRQGLRITFDCETCGPEDTARGPLELVILQHKGMTYIYWEENIDPLLHDPMETWDTIAISNQAARKLTGR